MRILLVMSLFLTTSAFAQRVVENVKQQTVLNGTRVVVNDFDTTPVAPRPPVPNRPKK